MIIKTKVFLSKPMFDMALTGLVILLVMFVCIMLVICDSLPQDVVPVPGEVDLEVRQVVAEVQLAQRVNYVLSSHRLASVPLALLTR